MTKKKSSANKPPTDKPHTKKGDRGLSDNKEPRQAWEDGDEFATAEDESSKPDKKKK